jgi:molybdate transport system ATP-binding protein
MSVEARFRVDYPDFTLDVDLTLPARGVTALFGASGSGKTTLLRAIAGLASAHGRLVVAGEVWQDGDVALPTHQRPLGYVFQEASLFPHLSVIDNLRFGQRRAGADGSRLKSMVEWLGIVHLLERRPDGLSGGERQRVAIARALLTSPRLLLMDEPLAALDGRRKQEILPYLERMHRELEIPVIYVSHSVDEVARLADHLVLLDGGRVLGQGPLLDMLSRIDTASTFADEPSVVIEGVLGVPEPQDEADFLSRLVFPGGTLWTARRSEPPGTRLRCRILARDVSIARHAEESSILNRFGGAIIAIGETSVPGHLLVRIDVGGTPLLARITRRSARNLALVVGDPVIAQVKAVALTG